MNIRLFLKQKIRNSFLKKIVAIFTTTCFLISVVLSQTVYATVPLPNSLLANSNLLNTPSNVLIPFNLGRITDSFYADSDGDVVINIQDLHSHAQTQRNIGSILSILDSKYGLDKIYVEGASGQLNTSWLANIQDQKTKEKVLNNLLESGRLTGGEYFSIRSDKNTILQGLENSDIYSRNSVRLKEIYNKEKEVQNYISILTNILNKKSEQYYSKENKKINKIIKSYKNGEIRTDEYIELLLQEANKARVDVSKYKSIIFFVKLVSKQKSFDSKKLNSEIKELLADLKEKITFEEYKELTQKSTKKEFEVEFYFDLLKKAKDLNLLGENKYKNTNAFFEYLIINQELNPIELTKNEEMFIGELTNKLATTENEKNILFLQNYLESLSHYLTNKMTAQEYESFLKNLEKFKLLWAKYIDIDNITNITKYLDLAKDFYKSNMERNRIFVSKLLGKMPQEAIAGFRIKSNINHKDKVVEEILKGKKIHVVITGGFHTHGFNKLLEDQNINYIVITPNVTDNANNADKLYKNIFNEEYEITKTTFANRPITEVVMLLNKGEIKEINPVGNGVEIKYVSGETISLNNIKEDFASALDVLSPTQAEMVSQAVLDIQDLLKTLRENAGNISIEAISKLKNLETLVESIDNADVKEQLKSQITTIKENNPTISPDNFGKMILPSTRKILNKLFGFIKNKNIKNRIMSIGSSIIENTFLFPLIIFAPEKFALLHYNKKDRNYIKEVLYDLEQLYSIRAQLQTLQDLSGDTKDYVKYQSQLDNLYEQLTAIDKNLNDLDINELDFAIEERENILADCGYTTIYEGTKDMFQSGLAGVVFVSFFAMLGIVGSMELSNSLSEVWISFIGNIQYLFYSLIGSFALGFYGSHISHNLQIDSKISKAEKSLRSALYDLVDYLPNDVSYENVEDLEGMDFVFVINGKEEYVRLSVILADILNLFDTNFFIKDFMKDVSQELEPLTYKEIIKGIIARGENVDTNKYATNINTIIDAYSSLNYKNVALILKNIEQSLIVLKKVIKINNIGNKKNLTAEDKEILKLYEILNNYRKSIKEFKTKYWKLNIGDSRKKQPKLTNKYEVNIFGKKYFVEAVSLADAFNKVVFRISDGIKYKMYNIKEDLGFNRYRDDIDRKLARQTFKTKKARDEAEKAMLEDFYKRFIKLVSEKQESVSAYSQRTNKPFYKRKPKSGEYPFTIVVPGINDTKSLSAFQEVYARSPRQAITELVITMCYATEKGNLKDGIYEEIAFSKANINEIVKKLSEKYPDSQLKKIIKNVRANSAPVIKNGVVKQISQIQKPEEFSYRVVIPNFNDRAGLEYYQYVYAKDMRTAIEKAVLAIIKAKERDEIKGGYYNYRAINSSNKENILGNIYSNYKDLSELVTKQEEEEKVTKQDEEKLVTKQEKPTYVQLSFEDILKTLNEKYPFLNNIFYKLSSSQTDTQLKKDIEMMLDAGFSEQYTQKLMDQYLSLRAGVMPQDIYSKINPINFGTAGVRGIMGEEIDFLDVSIITQAIANVIDLIAKTQKINYEDIKVFVGGDSRFLSRQFAEIVSNILSANNINVTISSDDIPSPAISYYTRAEGYTLSINITASHNPKEHNGYKITLGDGGQAGLDVTSMIENEIKNIQQNLQNFNAEKVVLIGKKSNKIESVDVKSKFIDAFIKMITKVFEIDNNEKLNSFKQKASEWTVVVDPKNGATKKYFYEILNFFGFNIEMMNDNIDPTFGGQKPEPSFENTKQLRQKVAGMKQDKLLGMSTDVDGDRFAVVDKDGNFITANSIGTILLNFRLKMLFDKLISDLKNAENKDKQNEILKQFVTKKIVVPRNCATTHVLDDLATYLVDKYYKELGNLDLDKSLLAEFKNIVDVKELNVGFKYFAQAKHEAEEKGDIFLLGVESSGGISIAEWIYDKCGFLANLMLLFVLVENNMQPNQILSDDVYSKIGYQPYGIETAISFREIVLQEGKYTTLEDISKEAKTRQENLMSVLSNLKPNKDVETVKNMFTGIDNGLVIKEIRTNDGIKIIFENDTWLLIRPSGTEPIVRVFNETKGDKELSEKLVNFVTDNGGQILIDKIEDAINKVEATKLKASVQSLKTVILDSIETLQRLTYYFLFKDNMEYTMVAKSDDLSRVKKAQLLAQSGIKVNLVLVGDTSLIKETESRISTENGELAFCLINNSNKNLTVYGYNDSYGQDVADITVINKQSALIAMLRYINDSCDKSIKILDMPENIDKDIITTDIENFAQDLFTNIGIGKTITKIFADTLKKKIRKTDDMFIKPSLVASNISSQEIDNYGIEQIKMLKEQAVTTIIISADDELIKSKSKSLKNLLQMAHDNGLKVMFNYSFDFEQLGITNFIKWISNFNNTISQFKDNGGIDGLQLDLSNSGEFANLISVLLPVTKLAKIINEQNVGSFLSVKMPSTIDPAEYVKIFKDNGIKLVVDYNSQIVSKGIAEFSSENIIINISSDKNGIITISKLSDIFENNKVSMISFDSSILEAMDTTEEGFSFAEMSITKLITSIFETTPDGQVIKGINKGRQFVENRSLVLVNNLLIENLYRMYTDDNISVIQVNSILETEFKENISKYELKGFVKGVLEVIELKNVNATDISFDKTQYFNLLMNTLFEYRQLNNKSFENDETKDVLSDVLNVDKFSDKFKPKISEVHNILTGNYSDRVDSVISVLASLKDNTELSYQERCLILEGLLLLLLGYARQDILNVDNLVNENTIANIKEILSAA